MPPMLESRIQQNFFESADLHYQIAETIAKPLADAAATLLSTITAGGKVISVGHGASHGAAQTLIQGMLGSFERDRPPLAAVLLLPASTIAWASQIQALAQPGDVVVLFKADVYAAKDGTEPASLLHHDFLPLIQATHAQDAAVVMMTGPDAGLWQSVLTDTDVLIAVPHSRPARVQETHLVAVHSLLDALDLQLLGEQDHL